MSLDEFSFEPEDDQKINRKIRRKLNKSLKNCRDLAKPDETPYIDKAIEEYETVYKEYES